MARTIQHRPMDSERVAELRRDPDVVRYQRPPGPRKKFVPQIRVNPDVSICEILKREDENEDNGDPAGAC